MRKESEKYQTDIKVVKEEIIRIDLHAIIAQESFSSLQSTIRVIIDNIK
jgi:hypothetical protein